MRYIANPIFGYFGAVFGVIAVASIAFFNLQGMAAKAHRHWDADIDRIVAQQQEKRHEMEMAALARAEHPAAGPQIAALTTNSVDDDDDPLDSRDAAQSKEIKQNGKKNAKRGDRRRQHFLPTAFATLPKFASTAAATTTTLLRLR